MLQGSSVNGLLELACLDNEVVTILYYAHIRRSLVSCRVLVCLYVSNHLDLSLLLYSYTGCPNWSHFASSSTVANEDILHQGVYCVIQGWEWILVELVIQVGTAGKVVWDLVLELEMLFLNHPV
uniref:Uncharacterized protein n=1 Tax=Ananas comosus var. bracteatus TaxID=296719 RepID=A0A6V7PKQ2_ANACO|nr:unnamed protein product [Ananas comosus var. bracteatus]